MSEVCDYFKFGYCKYGERCFKKHVQETCEIINCDVKDCQLRHQKKCSYFQQFKYCKFGAYCQYKHEKQISYSEEEFNT